MTTVLLENCAHARDDEAGAGASCTIRMWLPNGSRNPISVPYSRVTGSWVKAKISMRLVRNQDPDKIYDLFERYVRDLVGDMGRVTFKKFGAGRPFLADLQNPFIQAGLRALEAGFGKPAIALAMGGSIPIVAPLVEITGSPCALMGFGLPGDNLHAPNEHFPIECFLGGARSAAAYLNEVASAVDATARR